MKCRLSVLSAVLVLPFLVACQTAPKVTMRHAIGMVFDIAGRGDLSYNDLAYRGLVELARKYQGSIQNDTDKVQFGTELQIRYSKPAYGNDRERQLRTLAEGGYPLIYCIGFLFSDPLERMARDFPNTHFVIIDAYVPDLTQQSNITCVSFKENEGAFLVGAIAALKAEGKPIGFLGGMDIPLIHRFQNGFMGGAIYADRSYRKAGMILSSYAGKTPVAFNDPARGYQLSKEMFANGASIIFHASGGTGDGLFKAATEVNKDAIGVDSDQGLIYRSAARADVRERAGHILTSMIKRIDVAVVLAGSKFLGSGEHLDGGYWTIGLKDDGLDFAKNDYNRMLLADIEDRILQIKADVADGKVEVPDIDTDVASWADTLQ